MTVDSLSTKSNASENALALRIIWQTSLALNLDDASTKDCYFIGSVPAVQHHLEWKLSLRRIVSNIYFGWLHD